MSIANGDQAPRKPRSLTLEELEQLADWLTDPKGFYQFKRIMNEAMSNAKKRKRRRLSSYRVRNPDGTIYRKPKRRRRTSNK